MAIEGNGTLSFGRRALAEVLDFTIESTAKITVQDICYYTCKQFKITREQIMSADRCRRIARPRQLAMALSREMTKRSLPRIGRDFGGRDHTTVLHAMRRIDALSKANEDFAFEIATLCAELKSRGSRFLNLERPNYTRKMIGVSVCDSFEFFNGLKGYLVLPGGPAHDGLQSHAKISRNLVPPVRPIQCPA